MCFQFGSLHFRRGSSECVVGFAYCVYLGWVWVMCVARIFLIVFGYAQNVEASPWDGASEPYALFQFRYSSSPSPHLRMYSFQSQSSQLRPPPLLVLPRSRISQKAGGFTADDFDLFLFVLCPAIFSVLPGPLGYRSACWKNDNNKITRYYLKLYIKLYRKRPRMYVIRVNKEHNMVKISNFDCLNAYYNLIYNMLIIMETCFSNSVESRFYRGFWDRTKSRYFFPGT